MTLSAPILDRASGFNLETKEMHDHQLTKPMQASAHRVAHDLKNPLCAAREFVALVLDEVGGPVTDTQRELLSTTLECCDNITEIMDAWLAEIDNNE